jgi:hypothetical protein
MELAPHSTWSELIPLDPMFPFEQPGKYRLQIIYTTNGDRIESAPMEFQIVASNVTAYAAVPQGPETEGSRLSTAWAHGGDADIAIVDAVRLGNLWGKDAGGKLYSSVVYRGTGSPVRQIAVPAMHRERGMDFSDWIVWEQDGKVHAQRTESGNATGQPELVYTAASQGLRLVQPPVMDRSHDLSLFVVDVQNGAPHLVKISLARAPMSSASVQYRVRLTSTPAAAQAAHFSENEHGRTVIFLLAADATGMALSAVQDVSTPRVLPLTRLDNERPMTGACLAVYSRDDGRTYVAVATAPSAQGTIGVNMVEVASSGEKLRGPSVRSLDLSGTRLVWGFLAGASDGPHLLWRTDEGELLYASEKIRPVSLIPKFRSNPPPSLLLGEGKAFVAGARETGTFGVEYLSRRNINQFAAK